MGASIGKKKKRAKAIGPDQSEIAIQNPVTITENKKKQGK
ncbi:28867_t:CDS:2 [Gigaspora margarita]|uniref:28867_t:CDS:1 n=1 Tax=Gigaspora margarita TaxID=4874 RepID=A0ABN7US25_GIGMA|nr:28867_t:CDS:2 [Gigaspora margarita]